MRKVSLALVAVLVACCLATIFNPLAHAGFCHEGEVAQLSAKRGKAVCVVVTPPKGGQHKGGEESGSGDDWSKPGLPDNSKVRKGSDLPVDRNEWTWDEWTYYQAAHEGCWGITDPEEYLACQVKPWVDSESGEGDEGPPPRISPEQAAREVLAKLEFTAVTPVVGPNRDHHDMPFDTAVGYPVWLWTTGGTSNDSVTETVGPLTVSISIRLDKVVWDLGDGSMLRCDKGTKWRRGTMPGKKSPSCGHIYKKPGKYVIEATSHWTITWTAGGQSGTIPYSMTADRPFEVGEIHVLVR